MKAENTFEAISSEFCTKRKSDGERAWSPNTAKRSEYLLGGVDKFEPVSGGGDMDHSEEAVGQLVVSGGDRSVDLEVAEHALDTVALLVERPIMFDFHAAV
jgi:uncharacterized protein GlcG (DUF336 family)